MNVNIYSSIKILIVACTEEEISDSIVIANKLAGIDYNYFEPWQLKSSNLRILEFTWNNTDIEMWNILPVDFDFNSETLPPISLMDACGLILLSNNPPIDFIRKNNSYFNSMEFPILWFTTDTRTNSLESSLHSLNVSKVTIKSPNDSVVPVEFNQLLNRIRTYIELSRTRNDSI